MKYKETKQCAIRFSDQKKNINNKKKEYKIQKKSFNK